MVKTDFERRAADSLRAGIALLDGDGIVRWTNPGWTRCETKTSLVAAARVGSDLLALARDDVSPLSAAILSGVSAVLAGATSYVELQSEANAGGPVMVAITPTRSGRGAVILYAVTNSSRAVAARLPLTMNATRIAEHLTPRELEVLTRVASGLSNRAIARELGIEYTTVRGHVQSLLAKLGARTRVGVVALAYRSGLLPETEGGPSSIDPELVVRGGPDRSRVA